MKKVWITGLLLVLVVAEIVFSQTAEAAVPEDKTEDTVQTVVQTAFDRGRTDSDDSDAAPQSVISVLDGMIYKTGLAIGDAPEGYFEDALFIGDSRMVGLRDYGGIENSTWYCTISMGVMNYQKKSVSVEGYGTISLTDLMAKKSFKRVYISLGINEIGYDLDMLKGKYDEFVQLIKDSLPGVKIIFMSNMHVSKSRSDTDKYVNNPRINELEEHFKEMQDGYEIFYMDINKLFDDANGALDAQYTGDGTHIYGKYYSVWADYIRSHAVYEVQ